MRRLRKKGYYFVLDALIGSTIIFISLMILLSGGVRPTKIQYNYEMAEEYSSFILNTKIQDLKNSYVNSLLNTYINDTSLTIMEQIDLFYYQNDEGHAWLMMQNLTEPMIPEKYSYSYDLVINGGSNRIYNRTVIPITDARIIIASSKITFLQIDSSTMFGPAMAELKIWI